MTAPNLQQQPRRFANTVDGTLSNVEVRKAANGTVTVSGHATVFNSPTQIGPPGLGWREQVAPGAFSKTLADKADVRLLFNHNPDLVLARSKSGTLRLSEDKIGLRVEADLAPTTVGRDLAILLERGDVSQMSFGFQVTKQEYEDTPNDPDGYTELRTIREAKLFDVSAVTYPAYDDTDLAIREATIARELRSVAPATPQPSEPAEPPVTLGSTTAIETPEEPAAATPVVQEVEERELAPVDLLLRHMEGSHRAAPRALCSACARKEPESSTPA